MRTGDLVVETGTYDFKVIAARGARLVPGVF